MLTRFLREPKDSTSDPSTKATDHKNEGFLKSAWHKLTHQHDNLEPENDQKDQKDKMDKKDKKTQSKDEEEPKKASGSG